MDRTVTKLSGSSQATLNDRDIAHIARVMGTSLRGDLAGPILPAAYWRKRLHQLLDTGHLSHAQLCTVDSLLMQSRSVREQASTGMRRVDACGRPVPTAFPRSRQPLGLTSA